jgi:SAM-dependent methyltransferase
MIGGTGRILDVGCGAGAFLTYMRECGWRAKGLDINPAYVQICREHGHDVEIGGLSELTPTAEKFDCVAFLDSLGYTADPLVTLHLAAGLLRQGGVLVVEDANTSFHSVSRRLWTALSRPRNALTVAPFPPRRLFVFGPAAYHRLFNRAGLQSVHVIPACARTDGAAWMVGARRTLYAGGEAIYHASRGRWVVTPSLLAFGRTALAGG